MNEDELRAALQRDAGKAPDAESVVAAARAAATKRRVRLLSTVSSVAVVAAIAVTVGVLATGHDDRPPAGRGVVGSPSGVTSTRPSGPGATDASPSMSVDEPGAHIPICPDAFPESSGTDATGRELPTHPATVEVCAYGSTGTSGKPASLTLTGEDATRLVASLNAAPTSRPHVMCPQYRVAEDHRFAFVGVADGPVVTTLGNPTCSVVVDTPTGTRYAWAPPADIASRILALQPSR